MAAQLQIDQERLTFGVPGTSRTDGADDGAIVTLTNTGSGSTTTFRLLWTPPGDTTAVATLAATEDPKVWTFEPTPERYGSYLVELIEDEGLVTEVRERRVLVVRTPVRGLVIPALNERGDPRASLVLAGTAQVEAAANNAIDYTSDTGLNDVPYAAWWRSVHELTMAVDASGITPFLHVRYVDGRTEIPNDQQIGSIDRPFRSLQAAIESIPATVEGYTPVGGVLLIAGANYMSESLSLPTAMAFVGLGSGNNTDIPAARVVIGNVDCAGFEAEFRDVTIAGEVTNGGGLRSSETSFFGAINAIGLRCTGGTIVNGITADFFFASGCASLSGPLVFNTGEIVNSGMSAFTATVNVLDIDRYSFERAKFAGGDFSGVSEIHVLDQAGTFSVPEQIEVTAPELVGGSSVFVDVVVTGTALGGVDAVNLVLANPVDDDSASLFRSVRVLGFDTLRFELQGVYAGGSLFFLVSRLF